MDIHARETKNGLKFRAWSNTSDMYISKEMTEKEMREWCLKVAVCDAIERHSREIDGLIERATSIGTSSEIHDRHDTQDLQASWKNEKNV